jgi:acetyl esterase/lipase
MSERLRNKRPPKWYVKIVTKFITMEQIREHADKNEPLLIGKLIEKGFRYRQEDFEDGGVGQWVSRSKVPPPEGETIILYFGGGGFMINNRGHLEFPYRITAPVAVYGFKYQCPSRYPTALEQCTNIYRHLCKRGYKVIVAGDSAGGNLALSTCLKLQAVEGAPVPVALYLAAPALRLDDSALEDPSIDKNEKKDANSKKMLKYCQETYFRYEDISRATEVSASPGYATPEQMSKLPPTYLSYSKDEMLKDQAEQMGEKMKTAGVDVTLTPFPPGGPHLEEYYATGKKVGAYWKDHVDAWLSRFIRNQAV